MEFLKSAEMQVRCAALRLQPKEIASLAKCHQNTAKNILRGAGGQGRTLERLYTAIAKEELRLRDHLLALHPLERESVKEAAE